MSQARLATSILVGGLVRKAESEGGFAAVLAKGDPTAGSVLIVLVERGGDPRILERSLQPDGRYVWQQTELGNPADLRKFLDRRRGYDPDIWILELDVPSRERFAAGMIDFD
jgi:hypothetical protein